MKQLFALLLALTILSACASEKTISEDSEREKETHKPTTFLDGCSGSDPICTGLGGLFVLGYFVMSSKGANNNTKVRKLTGLCKMDLYQDPNRIEACQDFVIELIDKSNKSVAKTWPYATTGEFIFTDIPAGEYQIRATSEKFHLSRTTPKTFKSGDHVLLNITFTKTTP